MRITGNVCRERYAGQQGTHGAELQSWSVTPEGFNDAKRFGQILLTGGDGFHAFLQAALTPMVAHCRGAIYVAMSSSELDTLQSAFRAAGGEYTGRWFDEKFRKPDDDPDARAERLFAEDRARGLAARCAGKPGIVSEESRPATQAPPPRHHLTNTPQTSHQRKKRTPRKIKKWGVDKRPRTVAGGRP